jgi:hypothetical protein
MKFQIGGLDAHPTKGYRGFARPRGTNTRRKLIPTGACLVPLSHEHRLMDLDWDPKLTNNRRARDRYALRGTRKKS